MGTTKQAENGNKMVDDRSDYERSELIGNLISLRLKGRSTNARDMADFGRPYPLPFFDDGG